MINGMCINRTGRPILDLSFNDLLDFTYFVFVEGKDEEEIAEFELILEGARGEDGRVIATDDLAGQMDAFDSFVDSLE